MLRTDRDIEILDALTCRVRLFSLEQLAAAWWSDASDPTVHARRRLAALVEDGWLTSTHVHAGPMLALTQSLAAWSPGGTTPDIPALARRLAERWASSEPPRRLTVFSATAPAHAEFGGPSRPKRLDTWTATHDLNFAAVYLLFRRTRPSDARDWIGEDLRPKAGYRLKDPDAVIERNGREELVVELGGKYSESTIRAFHEDCARRGRGYELW